MRNNLNHRQWRFVELRVQNPTWSNADCAENAGYSKSRSYNTGSDLMKNPLVIEEIERQRQPIVRKMQFDYQEYYAELRDLQERARREGNQQLEHQVLRTLGEISGVFVKRVVEKRVDATDPDKMSGEELKAEMDKILSSAGLTIVKKANLEAVINATEEDEKRKYILQLKGGDD